MHAKITGDAWRLRILIGESDRHGGLPLYHAIVRKAKELGLAGATVTRGFEGYGAASRIKTANILNLSADLPVIVEVIDSRQYIDLLLPHLDDMVEEGLITLDPVQVVKYAHRTPTGPEKHLNGQGPQAES